MRVIEKDERDHANRNPLKGEKSRLNRLECNRANGEVLLSGELWIILYNPKTP